jgi:hypothetical protein
MDLRYFSNANAFSWFLNAVYVTNSQGLYFAVCGDWPQLWALNRDLRFSVNPQLDWAFYRPIIEFDENMILYSEG